MTQGLSRRDQTGATLASEMRAVQRTGLARLDTRKQAPELLRAAKGLDYTSGTERTLVRQLLERSIQQLGSNLAQRTLEQLFGLNEASRGLHPTTLRIKAAQIWGVEPTTFRRVPMQTLLDELSDHIIEKLPETYFAELGTGDMASDNGGPQKSRPQNPQLQVSIGTKLDETNNYVICAPNGSDKLKRGEKLSVGGGGSGTVYCVRFKNAQLRAVKFLTFNYLDEDRTGRREDDFTASFGREIDILYKLSHGNIARLHDSGAYQNDKNPEASWPYLVTEFIAGPMLKDAIDDPEVAGQDIYRIFSEVIGAVQYLHRNDVYHSDIKHENIKLRQVIGGPSEAVLLDLGAAHWLGEDGDGQRAFDDPDAQKRYQFISTERITHSRYLPYLKAGSKLSKDDLRAILPSHDLYSLGVLLEEIIGSDDSASSARSRLRKVIGDSGILVLDEIIRDLLRAPDSPETTGAGFIDIEQVADDWRKLHPNYLYPAGTPELSLAGEFRFSLLTAAGRTTITPRLGAVINHKYTQRLREIPQLEYTSLKFLGATHTRLSHSSAVYRNTRYYLAHLLNEARFRRMVDSSDLQATLLLALLHDVGHFQLSHMFEDFASDQALHSEAWTSVPFRIPTDDNLFMSIVSGDDDVSVAGGGAYAEQIRAAYEESRASLRIDQWHAPNMTSDHRNLGEVIIDGFGEPTYRSLLSIHATIYGHKSVSAPAPQPAHRVLGGVISSDIDADKTAYLVEDSARTGVSYGQGVDLDGILGNICTPSDEDLELTRNPMIGIGRKGVTAAQSVAINRNAMLTAVYWNRSNRAATAMVKFVVARLLQCGALDMPTYIRETFFHDREFAMTYLRNLYGERFSDRAIVPIAGLLQAERRLYKEIFATTVIDQAEEFSDRLLSKRFTEVIALEIELQRALTRISGLEELQDGEVLLDIPFKERERPSGERGGRVIVYDSRPAAGKGRDLINATPLMAQLKGQHRALNRICRVFLAPHRFGALDDETLAEAQRTALDVITASIGA